VYVKHGLWVEVTEQWFCEGAWNGEFNQGEFGKAIMMGSGGKLMDGGVLVAAPSHTLERLHLLRHDDRLWISNSLPFVLEQANDRLDIRYEFYRSDMRSIIEGLNKYVRRVPTHNGSHVELYYHCNLVIGQNLDVREERRMEPTGFVNFATYKAFLETSSRAITSNAADVQRRIRYKPIATISSGYDSPATAVFARAVGCDEALTFRTAHGGDGDSGQEIAKVLGMRVKEFDRMEYANKCAAPEAEFLASGPEGNDVIMLAWEKDLKQRIVFTGFHGDKIWDVNNAKVSRYIVRGDVSGTSLGEFRLRVGFIHLPLPFLGCASHPSIHRISRSEEMKAWCLGGDYDRPIPRRICEEAGIDRCLFGQKKKRVAISALTLTVAGEQKPREGSLNDFMMFYRRHRSHGTRLVLFCMRQVIRLCKSITPIMGILRALASKIRVPYGVHRTDSLLNQWAIERIKLRYHEDTLSKERARTP
jgi:hypothetical protein